MKKRFTHVCKNALNKTFQSKIEFEDAENSWTNCRLRPPCAKDKLKKEKERKENSQTVGNLLSHVLVVVMRPVSSGSFLFHVISWDWIIQVLQVSHSLLCHSRTVEPILVRRLLWFKRVLGDLQAHEGSVSRSSGRIHILYVTKLVVTY